MPLPKLPDGPLRLVNLRVPASVLGEGAGLVPQALVLSVHA